ncbi:MAG TPA: hypothetical protein VLA14_06790 [Polyangia bacterium]|nr:hypothetical protein [Polyangia bacterium]
MTRPARVALVAAFMFAVSSRARAEVCADAHGAVGGPLAGGTDSADFGAIPEACAATDVSLRLRGTLLVASSMPDYFGEVVAASTLRLRQPLGHSRSTWISLAADLLTYRYTQNAVEAAQGLSLGPLTFGVHRALGDWTRTAATAYVRALLPPDTARQSGQRTGLELGVTGRRLLGGRGRFGVQGGAAMTAPVVIVAGQTHSALQPVALAEAWFAPRPDVALSAGLESRAEIWHDPTFLTLAPRLAARLALRRGLSAALLVEVPVVGEDRTDLVAAFFLGWAAPP